MSSISFQATVETGGTYAVFVTLPESAEVFGTRRPVKVRAEVDGHAFDATLMPSGDGPHWLPLRAAVVKATGKGNAGDVVEVRLERRGS